jgi:superfamily I DNA/RNA helicase
VHRLRSGKVIRQAGFDGQFGIIHVFEEGELDELAGQQSLFGGQKVKRKKKKQKLNIATFAITPTLGNRNHATAPDKPACNPQQQEIIQSVRDHILVSAGPGTGKTFTLIERLIYQISKENINPQELFCITFTNHAAGELQERLSQRLDSKATLPFCGTFHQFCLYWLKKEQSSLSVFGDDDRTRLIKLLFQDETRSRRERIRAEIISHYHTMVTADQPLPPSTQVKKYFAEVQKHGGIDLEGIIPEFLSRLGHETFRQTVTAVVKHLYVDEFQDVNLVSTP